MPIPDGSEPADAIEPAWLQATWGRIYQGQRTADDDLPYDFWSTGAWKEVEVESSLRIHNRDGLRNIDDWWVTAIRRWEVLIEGTTKHQRQQVDVVVKLTPSHLIEAARSIGG